ELAPRELVVDDREGGPVREEIDAVDLAAQLDRFSARRAQGVGGELATFDAEGKLGEFGAESAAGEDFALRGDDLFECALDAVEDVLIARRREQKFAAEGLTDLVGEGADHL